MLTLTSSSALNSANSLQPMFSREILQLLGNKAPQAVPTKQRPRAGARRSLLLVARISPHSEFHCGSVAIPGPIGLSGSRSCPSFHAFSRNSSGGLALQGWAEEFSRSCYCQDGVVAGQGLKSQDSAPAAAVVKPSS